MNDLISRQEAISLPVKPKEDRYFQTQNLDDAYDYGWRSLQKCIEKLPSAQPEIVRCKDCKHRPTGTDRDDLEFPDDKCPCKCEDYWYSWKPVDDWFCGNGERKKPSLNCGTERKKK